MLQSFIQAARLNGTLRAPPSRKPPCPAITILRPNQIKPPWNIKPRNADDFAVFAGASIPKIGHRFLAGFGIGFDKVAVRFSVCFSSRFYAF